jgi:hypothetical protein
MEPRSQLDSEPGAMVESFQNRPHYFVISEWSDCRSFKKVPSSGRRRQKENGFHLEGGGFLDHPPAAMASLRR